MKTFGFKKLILQPCNHLSET